ncbi:MAG TPA: hypothetical protein VN943_08230 [Candidatus Acidoferrum sp.]|nr:hypothetical protein [Candidatus Acidoferrum sp.]
MAQSSGAEGSSSNSLFWMMVAVVSAVVILVGAGVFASSRVISSMASRAGAENLTVHTPTADFRVEQLNDIGPGLPLYPRAVLLLPGTIVDETMPQSTHARLQTTAYYTDDTRDLADSWYLQHLSAEFARHKVGDPQPPDELSEVIVPVDSVVFVGKRGDQVRMVTLTSNSSGTRITLVRFTKRQAE